MNTAIELLLACDDARIKLEVVGPNKLNYVCPKGALSEDLKKKIILFKPSIIKHLTDVDNLIAALCKEYSTTRSWLDQFVICPHDVEDLRTGVLSLSCLRAHIEYHPEAQKKWEEGKQKKWDAFLTKED